MVTGLIVMVVGLVVMVIHYRTIVVLVIGLFLRGGMTSCHGYI